MSFFKRKSSQVDSDQVLSTSVSNRTGQNMLSTQGAIGIKVISDPPNADIDIVLVHGLTGNRDQTWTHTNGTFWPQDLLAKDFPHARVMTFGYDADVVRFWSMASSNRLSDHGRSLLYALLDQRQGSRHSTRPILFIAHSLGGLVSEEVLVLSGKGRDQEQSILGNTLGIIFMGTPHHGSALARWGDTAAKYLNIFHTTNRDIVRTLRPKSEELYRVEDEFLSLLTTGRTSLSIFCFYEALSTNDQIGKVVENDSAILRGHPHNSINANHSDLTKFSGHTDAGYISVHGVIARWDQDSRRDNTSNTPENSSTASPSPNAAAPTWTPGGINFHPGSISGHNVIAGMTNTGTQNLTFN